MKVLIGVIEPFKIIITCAGTSWTTDGVGKATLKPYHGFFFAFADDDGVRIFDAIQVVRNLFGSRYHLEHLFSRLEFNIDKFKTFEIVKANCFVGLSILWHRFDALSDLKMAHSGGTDAPAFKMLKQQIIGKGFLCLRTVKFLSHDSSFPVTVVAFVQSFVYVDGK